MSTIPKFYIEKRRDADKNLIVEDCNIRMYITIPDGRVEYSTGIKVDAKHFSSDYFKTGKSAIKIKAPNFDAKNQTLEKLFALAVSLRNKVIAFDPGMTKKEFKKQLDISFKAKSGEVENDSNFIEYLDKLTSERISGVRTQKNGKTYSKSNIDLLNSLSVALKGYVVSKRKKYLKFQDIDDDFHLNFKKYIFSKELTIGTFNAHITHIKGVYNEAISDKVVSQKYFTTRKFGKMDTETDSVYFDEESIKKIFDVVIEDPELDKTRDMLLIACYTGLRYSDYSKLHLVDYSEEYIRLKQKKTGDYVTIPISKKILPILEKYNGSFPKLKSKFHAFTIHIRKIARMSGLTHIVEISDTKGGVKTTIKDEFCNLVSSHIGRRTYATTMFKLGLPTSLIMAVTGHKTEKAFLLYVKATNEDKARMMMEMMKKLDL